MCNPLPLDLLPHKIFTALADILTNLLHHTPSFPIEWISNPNTTSGLALLDGLSDAGWTCCKLLQKATDSLNELQTQQISTILSEYVKQSEISHLRTKCTNLTQELESSQNTISQLSLKVRMLESELGNVTRPDSILVPMSHLFRLEEDQRVDCVDEDPEMTEFGWTTKLFLQNYLVKMTVTDHDSYGIPKRKVFRSLFYFKVLALSVSYP